jgi:TrmH family RNA methyltransferase
MLSINEVKHINALKVKKYRNKYDEFIAEGKKVIIELIQNQFLCKQLYLSETLHTTINLPADVPKKVILEADFKKISDQKNPANMLAIFAKPPCETIQHIDNWIIALDNIQDPGNLGAIIRIADWFGVSHIVCSGNCVDAFNGKTIQASMASIANVKIVETDLAAFFTQHRHTPVYGATLNGTDYNTITYPPKGILLIGNEGSGISQELFPYIHQQITIPRIGKAESLNAAVAAGVLLARVVNERIR